MKEERYQSIKRQRAIADRISARLKAKKYDCNNPNYCDKEDKHKNCTSINGCNFKTEA